MDEARNLLIQDMFYSGGLAKLGFVRGAGRIDASTQDSSGQAASDGLRAVLFFVTRPLSLSDVDILDWEPLLQHIEVSAKTRMEEHDQQ